jgi:hypothetical protein
MSEALCFEGPHSQRGIPGHAEKVEARATPNESHAGQPAALVGAGKVLAEVGDGRKVKMHKSPPCEERNRLSTECARRLRETQPDAESLYTVNVRSVLVLLILLALPILSKASELQPETSQAWDEYIQTVNLRLKDTLAPGQTFLWIDEMAARRQRVRQGEIVASRSEKGDLLPVPHGLIHDWIGAVFISGFTIADVFAVVHDYDQYHVFYKPTVVKAKLMGRNGEDYAFSGVGLKKVFLWTIVLGGEFESHCSQLDRGRCYCISSSTRIQEIQDYGQADERKLPPNEGPFCTSTPEERAIKVFDNTPVREFLRPRVVSDRAHRPDHLSA